MSKRMLIMLALTGLLFGGIFAYKVFQSYMITNHIKGLGSIPVAVSAASVTFEAWEPKITASASLRATNGVDVTTEIAGLVKKVSFSSGQDIQAGEGIIQLNADAEVAQLRSLEAQAELAQITYDRNKKQYATQSISKEALDTAEADLKSKKAQVAQQAATVAKKAIQAPFKGRLGISLVNLGQYLNPGDKIVTLQSLDPMSVDFYLPQQTLTQLAKNQTVTFTTDAYPHLSFVGKITAINPKVDPATRNVGVEAVLSNPDFKLLPGMYGVIEIHTGAPKEVMTLPQTAISYNPYGELVYVLKSNGKDQKGISLFTAYQQLVTVGENRGTQVQILKGLQKGDLAVTAGQLKLKNGSIVFINNTVMPTNVPHSVVKND